MSDFLSYHAGELEVQARAGVGSDGLAARDMYRPEMPSGVRRFLEHQRLAVFSTRDSDGRVWASLRSGEEGFLQALDEVTVEIGGYSHPDDVLLKNLTTETQAGILVIDLAARHRLRLNGLAQLGEDGKITLTTQQVYGNCPQYIQARDVVTMADLKESISVTASTLDNSQQRRIEKADTFFIASAHPVSGADASHRGGKPGFIRIENDSRLLFPDYSGNKMFNTLGNLVADPHAGLLIPDFASGAALQLSGRATILWDDPRAKDFPGAKRILAFDVERVADLRPATLLRFAFRDYSPLLP
ncbi:MAG TPA: pyridoxamine 5'-phosphate oxidase family protein [Terriglobales bacterium]|jgi:hypothetical protein